MCRDDSRSEAADPKSADSAMQQAVLVSILAEHPIQLTTLDLYRERGDPDDFSERDAVDRAVKGLVAAGLAHRSGPFIVPSLAAHRFDELLHS